MQHEGPINAEGFDGSAGVLLCHTFRCETGGEGVRGLLKDVTNAIRDANPFATDLCYNTQVVLGEVLNNIEEHGYQGKTGCPISLHMQIRETSILVRTTDFGQTMPGLQLPEKKLPDTTVAPNDLPEGGFGWFLIHTLAPNPVYKRRGNSNILDMVIVPEAF